jgi:hypothetical protein
LQRTPRPAADPHSDRERIIELFARRQPVYGTAEVVRLLGISEGQLADAIAKGNVGTEANDVGAHVIPWEDVGTLALEEWTPRMIEAALDGDRDEIPLLNQHRLIRVSLPIYLIRLTDHLARFESATRHVPRNASDIIERILHDFANTHDAAAIDGEIPGFAQALTYPYFTPRRTGLLWLRCRYCGVAISEPVREVCRTCERRHEPNEHLGEYGLPELEEHDEPDTPQHAPTPRHRKRRTRATGRGPRGKRRNTD